MISVTFLGISLNGGKTWMRRQKREGTGICKLTLAARHALNMGYEHHSAEGNWQCWRNMNLSAQVSMWAPTSSNNTSFGD